MWTMDRLAFLQIKLLSFFVLELNQKQREKDKINV
jgi:hypothetical protein